jgi:hypothetical protein
MWFSSILRQSKKLTFSEGVNVAYSKPMSQLRKAAFAYGVSVRLQFVGILNCAFSPFPPLLPHYNYKVKSTVTPSHQLQVLRSQLF